MTDDVRPSARPEAGTASLQTTALYMLLQHAAEFTPEDIDLLPWTLQNRLWALAKEQYGYTLPCTSSAGAYAYSYASNRYAPKTLAVWKMFTAIKAQTLEFRYRREMSSRHVNYAEESLLLWAPALTSLDCHWLTALTISNDITYTRGEAIALSSLRNLVALDICSAWHQPRNVVDDGVIRAWGRHAKEAGAFPELRVLIVRHERGVTSQTLRYLNDLPSLALFGVQDCAISEKDQTTAVQWGWTAHDGQDMFKDLKRDITMSDTWDGPIRACVERTERLRRSQHVHEAQGQTNDDAHRDPPLLNFRLGPTSCSVIFNPPIIFFRALQDISDLSAPIIPRPTCQHPSLRRKTPKLRARRCMALTDLFNIQGLEQDVSVLKVKPEVAQMSTLATSSSPIPIPAGSKTHTRLDLYSNTNLDEQQQASLQRTPINAPAVGPRIQSVPAKKPKRDRSTSPTRVSSRRGIYEAPQISTKAAEHEQDKPGSPEVRQNDTHDTHDCGQQRKGPP